jgi:hypothetical protein
MSLRILTMTLRLEEGRERPSFSRSDDDIVHMSPEKKPVGKNKPVEEKKPEKGKIPVPAQVEADF